MEILKEIVPQLRRMAFIGGANLPYPPRRRAFSEEPMKTAASRHGVTFQVFEAPTNDFDTIFAQVAAGHFDAAYIYSDILNQNITRICQLALRHLIPTMSEGGVWARCGLLVTYGQDFSWTSARAMDYVDKILRGAKPSELPVEQATKVGLVINLKTAKTLGLTIPPTVLALADEVIE
jgi:putative tryptophan/tyrosine transport system substrate-binding protein